MSEGFDVDLPALRTGAAGLRHDAETLGTAARGTGEALAGAGAAAGNGPLGGVAGALAAQLGSALSAAHRSVDDTVTGLDAAAGSYQSSDAAASRTIGLPGF